jgi:uncharacterized protein YgbK (DUF1537 family)
MSRLGCIADDYTGATDVAAALRHGGLSVVLCFGIPEDPAGAPSDALVVALKSRTLPAPEAVRASLAARTWLAGQGADSFYFKYCSTFDSTDAGNIGPVADALLDAAGAPLTIACPTTPEHGRTVYQGHLFVGNRLLSESGMRQHPLTPMTDSDLVRVLGRQTPAPVALVAHEVVRRGAAAIAEALEGLASSGVRHAVVDAVDDGDLRAIASAGAELPVLTGAAGLARAIGELASGTHSAAATAAAELAGGPVVILAGSLSATTREQVRRAQDRFDSFALDPSAADLLERAGTWLEDSLGERPILLHSTPPASGPVSPTAAATVERTIGALARHAVARGARRLVIAGGETSGAVVDALGIRSALVAAEEDRGVPWLLTGNDAPLALLLKSGNFGQPDLLVRAAERAP